MVYSANLVEPQNCIILNISAWCSLVVDIAGGKEAEGV